MLMGLRGFGPDVPTEPPNLDWGCVSIDSFPFYMGQVAVDATLRSLNGETLPSVVQTPQALIDSSNVDTPAAEIINWVAPTYVAG